MGMYTEFFFRTTLKKDLPADVLAIVKYMGRASEDPPPAEQWPDHPLFKCYRWEMLGRSSGQMNLSAVSQFAPAEWDNGGSLVLWCDFKNYDDEIGKFIDWISPYLDSSLPEFLGYSLYEEDEAPIIHMSPDKNAEWWERLLRGNFGS